ncbi:MAG: GGDEF domain-containing protein [Halieaceae bacterium]|jgi:diguanylate cyclase (GGDEF)-like protein|uniref:GGDEF domain-containing protein n=1 Tax=Haliea alexandrii TaxID=2448162 RepID=UPI000F0BA0B3|nr:GGDEF domain-containing protein [Haliea alexandrii]MCR9186570.1 GGDEF domain-containing protein [Halieaceae bacterium]
MTSSLLDTITPLLCGAILALVASQLFILHVLSGVRTPPRGLGLFTLYFLLLLLAAAAVSVVQFTALSLPPGVAFAASLLSSTLLLLAGMQRSEARTGRAAIAALAGTAALGLLALQAQHAALLYTAASAVLGVAIALLHARRSWRGGNAGDVLVAIAGIALALAMLDSLRLLQSAAAMPFGGTAAALHGAAHVLVMLGYLVAMLLEQQQQLLRMNTLDPLTRLLNRRGLESALHVTLANAARHGQPTAAIMLDIDHLRQLNSNFGDGAGDRALQQVSRCLETECRASDVISRYDDDTFLAVLPNSTLEGARNLAERIQQHLATVGLHIDDHPIPLTVSLGVADARAEGTLEQLCADARRALMLAKHTGRNRVAAVEHRPLQISRNGGKT